MLIKLKKNHKTLTEIEKSNSLKQNKNNEVEIENILHKYEQNSNKPNEMISIERDLNASLTSQIYAKNIELNQKENDINLSSNITSKRENNLKSGKNENNEVHHASFVDISIDDSNHFNHKNVKFSSAFSNFDFDIKTEKDKNILQSDNKLITKSQNQTKTNTKENTQLISHNIIKKSFLKKNKLIIIVLMILIITCFAYFMFNN